MTPRIVTGLAGLTALTIVAAALAVARLPEVAEVATVNEPAFPALRGAPDAVAKIEIATADGSFRLERTDGAWTAPARFGYAVDGAEVRSLVVALADMRLVERKTRRADRYARLEVEDLESPEAASRLVRLNDAQGTPLAEALLGRTRFRLTGGAQQGTYLRRPGDDQAWLASGGPRLKSELSDWLDRAVVDVARDDVRRVEIVPAAGPAYAAARDDADSDLELVEPADASEADETPTARLASLLAGVVLEDVRPAKVFAWPADTPRAHVETFGGAVYDLRLATTDDGDWLALMVSGDDAVSARTEGWVYRVPDYVADRMTLPLSEFLADGS